jgi:hypothetical protein
MNEKIMQLDDKVENLELVDNSGSDKINALTDENAKNKESLKYMESQLMRNNI